MNNETMINAESMTLADIVKENIRAAIVFEEYGLDFCCKGKRPLTEACADKNIDASEVIKSLENLNANVSSEKFDEWTPAFLVDYIVNNHHQYVRRMIP